MQKRGSQFFLPETATRLRFFGPNWKYNKHFSSAPVVGFLVDDMDEARKRLSKAGVELIGDAKKGENGYAWQHFRGPDGNIYEIVVDPQRLSLWQLEIIGNSLLPEPSALLLAV